MGFGGKKRKEKEKSGGGATDVRSSSKGYWVISLVMGVGIGGIIVPIVWREVNGYCYLVG
jgi:hypothetical protein